MRATFVPLLFVPLLAAAQRADDNAVKSAEDAFGNSVGDENIGLYSPFEVRGFSAVDAGNVRLDGLYFDRQTDPGNLLVPSSTMRVGISAQGYVLPAPTGIVEYELTRAGEQRRLSPVFGYGPFGTRFAELDVELPILPERLGVAGGVSSFDQSYESGTDERGWTVAIAPRWRPNESIEIIPFFGRVSIEDSEAEPLIFVSGPHLPPRIRRDHFWGQSWADGESTGTNYGVVTNVILPRGWGINLGAFRSQFEAPKGFADLFVDTTAEGLAEHILIADPDQKFASDSGELRISKRFEEGARHHVLYYSLRARDQHRRYGGSDVRSFGTVRIGERVILEEPDWVFGPQTREEVRQLTNAVAYQGRWADVAELSLGLQKTDYEKKVVQPGEATPQLGEDDPWLYNAGLALHATERLALYASYSTGLEEGGVAPENAANKDAAPPAIRTKQWDAGLRYSLTPMLKVVAGVFDIEKPYYSLDDVNVYRELGQQRHRGFEFSIAGKLTERLNVVVGTMLLEPRVEGEEVDSGRIGRIPVAQVERLTIASADYRLPWLPAVSVDATVTSISDRMASSDNRLTIPARSVLDIGARWRFTIGRAPTTVRFQLGNVFDEFGWRTNPAALFVTNAPRRFAISIAADFVGS